MATTPKERKQDMCPTCYLKDGLDEPLTYRLGSTQPLKCGRGHEFGDREEISQLTAQMNQAKRDLEPKIEKPVPTLDELPKPAVDITSPINPGDARGINVSPVDFIRLTSILGHFTDGSSLFGSVFALQQQLEETKLLLQRATDARAVSKTGSGPGVQKLGGDISIELVIPERHVGPIKDIAEANGMDVQRYMNAKVEDGLDSYWYY